VISAAFDQASREIGFVVTTTLPMTFVIGDAGQIKSYAYRVQSAQGTLMDKTVTKALKPALGPRCPSSREYTLFWYGRMRSSSSCARTGLSRRTRPLAGAGASGRGRSLPTCRARLAKARQVDVSKVIWSARAGTLVIPAAP